MSEKPEHPSRKNNIDSNDYTANEVIFGFVAAVGVNLSLAEKDVEQQLNKLGYEIVRIRITEDVLPQLKQGADIVPEDYYGRTSKMMDIGTKAREDYGHDIIALAVC